MSGVITFGAAVVDIFVTSPSLSLANNQLSLPYSSKHEMSQSLIASGGGATNAAVSFSRLGLPATCVSLLGDDPLSLYVFNDLQSDNVNTDYLVSSPGDATDYSVILVGPDGGRSIITNRGKTRLEANHLNWKKLPSCDWFYITSLEGNLDLLEQLIGYAIEHQIRVALNPGNRELLHSRQLIPLLNHLDVLLLNGAESELLTGLKVDSPHYWETLKNYGPKVVAITNGREGAYLLSPTNKLFSPIINTRPVDETGAGDSFGSALVAALDYQLDLSESLFWAIKNSASVVSHLGAKPGLLTYNQIK